MAHHPADPRQRSLANSIGADWPADAFSHGAIPSQAERDANVIARREPLPEARFEIRMRFERIFERWRITLSDSTSTLWESAFDDPDKIMRMVRKGGGIRCLADTQAVEAGIHSGLGIATLHLTRDQLARLDHPR